METPNEPTVGSAIISIVLCAIAALLWREVYSPWVGRVSTVYMALGFTTAACLYTAGVVRNYYRMRLARAKG